MTSACFIYFSQKFFCTMEHRNFCTEALLQKFLYPIVQKISVKSRWNKLISFISDFQSSKFRQKIGQNTILLTFQRWLHINIVFIKQIAVKVSKYKCSIILRRENSTTVKVWLLRCMIWWDMWTSNIPVSELAKRRRSGQLYVHMHYVYYFKARIKKKKKKSDRILFVIFDHSSFSSSVVNWVGEKITRSETLPANASPNMEF